jgi:hypothetical protein
VQQVDEVLTKEFQFRGKRTVVKPYSEPEFQCAARTATLKNKFYKTRMFIYQKLPPNLRLLAKGILRPKSLIKLLVRQTCGLLTSRSVRDGRRS